jgi:PAS domain S-box-containing protein
MTDENKTKKQLISELNLLRGRVANFEQSDAERKRIETALRESEAEKCAILDASIDRIRHVDRELKILWANKTTLALDMSQKDVIGQTCHKLFTDKEIPCEGCPNLKARETGQIERAVIHKSKVRGIDGETYWDLYIVPLKKIGKETTYFQIARNITNQKRAENSLRESEEMLRGIFSGSPMGIAIYDADGKLLDMNSAYVEIFGKASASETKAFNLFDQPIVPEYAREKLREFRSARYEFSLNLNIPEYFKFYKPRKKGTIHLDIQITPLWPTEKTTFRGYLVQVLDISVRKQAEEHIRILTHDLIKAHESERQKISRDLHDRIAQDLSTLKIGMDTMFDKHVTGSIDIKQRVFTLSKILAGTIAAVKDLSYELRPPELDQLGLVRTIFQYCEDFSELAGVAIDFFSAGLNELKLDFDTEINLFRLIQEALNNVKKHANAHRVIIRLVASFPNIILRIEDDGEGFDVLTRPVKAITEKRMGLQNMRERVSLLNGRMKIQSSPLNGTKIFIEIPHREIKNDTQEKHFDY